MKPWVYIVLVHTFNADFMHCMLTQPLVHLNAYKFRTSPAVRWCLWWRNASNTANGWRTSRLRIPTCSPLIQLHQLHQLHQKSYLFLRLKPCTFKPGYNCVSYSCLTLSVCLFVYVCHKVNFKFVLFLERNVNFLFSSDMSSVTLSHFFHFTACSNSTIDTQFIWTISVDILCF